MDLLFLFYESSGNSYTFVFIVYSGECFYFNSLLLRIFVGSHIVIRTVISTVMNIMIMS